MNRKMLLLAGCVVCFSSAIAMAAPSTKPATDPGKGVADTKTVKVERGSMPIQVEGEGVLEPVDAVEIRLKPKAFNGELAIKSVVANGASVKSGELLLEIEDKPILKDIATAENDLETSRAAYTKAQSDSDLQKQSDDLATKMAQDELKNAAEAIKWFDEVDGPQILQQADLMVKQARFALEDQNDELDQLRKMYKTEDLTSATADIVIKRSLRQVELTKIQVQRAEDDARKIKAVNHPESRRRLTFALDQQTNSLKQLNATHAQSTVQRKVALAAAKQTLTDAEQKVADLKKDAALFKQVATADGVVYYGQFSGRSWTGNDAKSFAVGEKMTSGSAVLMLIKPGKMRVAMDLPESKFLAIKSGMEAVVIPAAIGRKLVGKTDAPSAITKAGGLELLIDLGPVDPILTPGMKAAVSIDARKAEGILLVPASAVEDSKVWVKSGDETTPKHVITGRTGQDRIEIIDGVNEGDEILEQAQK